MKKACEKQDTKRQIYELDMVNYPCDPQISVAVQLQFGLQKQTVDASTDPNRSLSETLLG